VEHVEQMLSVIEQQIAVMRDLSELSRKKSRVIVNGDLPTLDTLLKGEQALAFRLGRLEEQRVSLQTRLARAEGLPPEALRLEEIFPRVPTETAERCAVVADQFAEAVDTLQFHNRVNSDLIQQALAFTEYNLAVLGARSAGRGQTEYAPKGRTNVQRKPDAAKRLDGRA
jgi:flagellar biosynthesis/type III secretory pathway chaperone